MIIRLKSTSEQECTALLAAAHVVDGRVRLPEGLTQTDTTAPRSAHSHDDENINDHCRTGSGSTARSGNASHHTHVEGATNGVDHGNSNPNETSIRSYELRSAAAVRHHFDTAPSLPVGDASSDDEFDVCPFISLDDAGTLRSFGPSSALHRPTRSSSSPQQNNVCITRDQATYSLIAKAAFQRQNERQAALLPDIHGMPTELAMHLLDLHWSRQHHTFLLTYRPAIMRDLLCNGPQCSRFLLYAIFACSSKYSLRLDVRDDPADPSTSGQRYFRHCDDLISRDCLLISPTIPTLVGLLLLGSTYNARGETSKGWLYTGYALRMLTDLGLHLDPRGTTTSPEEKEVRRRIFWGAFVCDKLQSLYLGRPVGINLKDCHVSRDFMDTYEEQELYIPYMDPRHLGLNAGNIASPQPIHSVSTFEQLCLLSKIMAKIINTFYVVGATFKNAQGNLQLIDDVLQKWRENLPPQLRFDPKLHETRSICPAPNQLNLHALHHTLVILLHRPFISDGHLRSTANLSFSWARCTTAARSITCIALAWKSAYGLGGAPYLLSYVTYVACTIHVRNVAAEANNGNRRDHVSMLTMSLACLDELCLANPGVKKPLGIIRASMEARNITLTAGKSTPTPVSFNSSYLPLDYTNCLFRGSYAYRRLLATNSRH
jgi:hypothetical protein